MTKSRFTNKFIKVTTLSITHLWGKNPEVARIVGSEKPMENKIPIMYFLGVSPGKYEAVLPAFIVDWNETSLKARVAFGILGQSDTAIPGNARRRYALRIVKQRLHQGIQRGGYFRL
jgi:putative restriction endonuclease